MLIYPVAIGGTRPPLFGELANVTGGRSFFIDDPKRLEPQLAILARELRLQYLLGYAPSAPSSSAPAWRSIHVTVSTDRMFVSGPATDIFHADAPGPIGPGLRPIVSASHARRHSSVFSSRHLRPA